MRPTTYEVFPEYGANLDWIPGVRTKSGTVECIIKVTQDIDLTILKLLYLRGLVMTDDLGEQSVIFLQKRAIESNENYYQALDGWWIEKIDGIWIFCASDPGFSAKDIRVQLIQEDFDYVRKTDPSAYEMMLYMKEKGLI